MKKLFTVIALCALGLNAFSQGKTWSKVIDVGAVGQFRTTWLLNSNVSDASGHLDYVMTFGGGGGLRVQYFGAGSFGFGAEFNYATINQKYEGLNTNIGNYESSTHLKCLDIPVFIKLGSSEGGYFELGAQYSIISSAEHKSTFVGALNEGDVSDNFKSSYIAPFLGFGGSFNMWRNQLLLTTGIRLAYGVTDVVGVDGLGQDLTEGNTLTYSGISPGYEEYKPTNPLYGALLLGVVYSIPLE